MSEADLLIALRRLADPHGSDASFRITHEGVTFDVEYVGGSASRLTLSADYDRVARAEANAPGGREAGYRKSAKGGLVTAIRPMLIELRGESSGDRQAKAEGVSREHQTGDEEFDRAVYVDSPTTDEPVLQAVLSEGVRAASVQLLALGFDWVKIDDKMGQVSTMLSSFGKFVDPDGAAPLVARTFASLLASLPPVQTSGAAHPRRSVVPQAAAVVGGISLITFGPIGLFGVASAFDCTESSSDGEGVTFKPGCGGIAGYALIVAIIAGVLVALVARALARPRMSGHSDSHTRIFYVTIAAFAWTALASLVATAYVGYSGHH